jgi:hypothetical protein
MQPFNIFSGEHGLGGALTNPTLLAKKKGSISKGYPVVFEGRSWPDAETAYHVLAIARNEKDAGAQNDELMAKIIACKFQQHPVLFEEVRKRGGIAFLEGCSHQTGAKSPGAQRWEGIGLGSRFIRNLVKGYALARSAKGPLGLPQQASLFDSPP